MAVLPVQQLGAPALEGRDARPHVSVGEAAAMGVLEDVPHVVKRLVGNLIRFDVAQGRGAVHFKDDDLRAVGTRHGQAAVGGKPGGGARQLHESEAVHRSVDRLLRLTGRGGQHEPLP